MVQLRVEDSPFNTSEKWAEKFEWDRNNAEDNSQSGRPKTLTNDEQVNALHCLNLDDRRLSIQKIAKSIIISSDRFYDILTEILGMSKLPTG